MAVSGRATGWIDSTFDSLHNRPFRILWVGSLLAYVAFMMSMTAQSIVAFELTGANGAVGAVMFGQGLAMLALAPVGGVLADRMSKRRLLLFCQSMIGMVFFVIALMIAFDVITVWYLSIAAFVTGTMFSLLGPARQAFIGEMVEPERRGNAIALTQVAQNGTRVVGPFLAGGLLTWQLVGAAGTYFVMASFFVVVIGSLSMLPPSKTSRRAGGPSMLADIALGIRHVRENPRLSLLVAQFVLIVMIGFPYMTVLPGFVKQELGSGAGSLGILMGVSAVGGLIVSLVVASLADSPRAPLLLKLSSLGIGITLILTGLAPSFALAAVAMFLVGGTNSCFQTLNNAAVMQESQPAYYGRVMSITMMAYAGSNVIGLPIGLLADAIGERGALVAMGTGVCLAVGLLALWAARVPGSEGPVTEATRPGGAAVAGPSTPISSPPRGG